MLKSFKQNIIALIGLLSCGLVFATATNHYKSDSYYMQQAINYAVTNPKAPFGAVIVDNTSGKVLCGGVNVRRVNPTFHGEIVAINNCAKARPNMNWSHATLYTTAEPCPMCQSAIIWANISSVVYATSMDYLIAHGWNQIKITSAQVNEKAPFYKGKIKGGVLAEKTNALFVKEP